MGTLVLIRHGQSEWNLQNRFTGWTDVDLTGRGESDAKLAAKALSDYAFDVAFTSRLKRAYDTLAILLKTLGQDALSIEYDSALNERHYGDLQGLNKAETAQKHGEEQVQLWRRDFFTRPPGGESMEDCERRVVPFFTQYILPHISDGKTVIVAAHGNSLRPLIKLLDTLNPQETMALQIGLCTPHVYTFEGQNVVNKEIIEVEGIVTKGSSLTQVKVEEGRV